VRARFPARLPAARFEDGVQVGEGGGRPLAVADPHRRLAGLGGMYVRDTRLQVIEVADAVSRVPGEADGPGHLRGAVGHASNRQATMAGPRTSRDRAVFRRSVPR
jgi:hypothetical protein